MRVRLGCRYLYGTMEILRDSFFDVSSASMPVVKRARRKTCPSYDIYEYSGVSLRRTHITKSILVSGLGRQVKLYPVRKYEYCIWEARLLKNIYSARPRARKRQARSHLGGALQGACVRRRKMIHSKPLGAAELASYGVRASFLLG